MYIAPHFIKSIHFVGIGGIGMSGIAEILHNQGYSIRGSDISQNFNIKRLLDMGIPITIGHSAENIRGAQALVISTAISNKNPEIMAARTYNIPIITRGEMLAEIVRLKKAIAISGTHGKTTTTSLISSILKASDFDPTIINGGIINTYQTNAKLGNGEWIVVEADESDGSFLKIPSIINIVTNIDCEHMNYYKTEENLEKAFKQFIRNLPFYGLGIVCSDHPRIRKIFTKDADRRIVTYGLEGTPHFKAENIRITDKGTFFDVLITQDMPIILSQSGPGILHSHKIHDLFIPMFGQHNILNSLAALAAAHELEINIEICKSALASFQGVKRRFTILGKKQGITFIDDYAHHPMEIKAVLEAGRQTQAKRIIAIFQPHRYSRFSQLFNDFVEVLSQADVVIAMPVYAAGEPLIEGINHQSFIKTLKKNAFKQAYAVNQENDLLDIIHEITLEGDFVIGLGAGNISDILSKVYTSFSL